MRSSVVIGMIVYRDDLGIQYDVCRIEQTLFEDDSAVYIFVPDYDVVDILPDDFPGIPGIDLALRRGRYVRDTVIPVFISERVPPRNRDGLMDELGKVGLDHYDALEWLIRTDTQYFGDSLFVKRLEDVVKTPFILEGAVDDAEVQCRKVLSAAGSSRPLVVGGRELSVQEEKAVCDSFRAILKNCSEHKCQTGILRGRRPVEVDPVDLEDLYRDVSKHRITADQAAERLGISRATLYRRLKQFGMKK